LAPRRRVPHISILKCGLCAAEFPCPSRLNLRPLLQVVCEAARLAPGWRAAGGRPALPVAWGKTRVKAKRQVGRLKARAKIGPRRSRLAGPRRSGQSQPTRRTSVGQSKGKRRIGQEKGIHGSPLKYSPKPCPNWTLPAKVREKKHLFMPSAFEGKANLSKSSLPDLRPDAGRAVVPAELGFARRSLRFRSRCPKRSFAAAS